MRLFCPCPAAQHHSRRNVLELTPHPAHRLREALDFKGYRDVGPMSVIRQELVIMPDTSPPHSRKAHMSAIVSDVEGDEIEIEPSLRGCPRIIRASPACAGALNDGWQSPSCGGTPGYIPQQGYNGYSCPSQVSALDVASLVRIHAFAALSSPLPGLSSPGPWVSSGHG